MTNEDDPPGPATTTSCRGEALGRASRLYFSAAYWTLLEYDGLPRSTLGPTFSSGIAWRPIWSGAALNAPLVGAILWGTTKLVSVAVVAPRRRRRARKNGVCRSYGYRLAEASTPLPICPECGTRIV